MSISIPEFWKLLSDSRLVPPEQCLTLAAEFGRVPGAAQQAAATTLAQWLVSRNVLTPFQAKILLGGRSGPFYYGDYKVSDRVATGRLKGSFWATHLPTQHRVLLQFQTGPATQDPDRWAAALHRSELLRRVVHPHVARLFDLVNEGSYKFTVGEALEGQTLADRLATEGPLSTTEACRVVRFAAAGLAGLHDAGEVHADLRPENVWIEPGGNVKLLCSPVVASPSVPTAPPSASAAAAAPVLADRALKHQTAPAMDPPDRSTDLHALACTLYESLFGKPPGADIAAGQSLDSHFAALPPPVARLLSQLLARNGRAGPMSAAGAVELLTASLDASQLQMAPASPAPTLAAYQEAIQRKLAVRPPLAPRGSQTQAASLPPRIPDVHDRSSVPAPTVLSASSVESVGAGSVSPIAITTAAPIRGAQPATKSRKVALMATGGLAILMVSGLLVAYQFAGRGKDGATPAAHVGEQPPPDETIVQSEPGDTPTTAQPAGITQSVLDDDGTQPWASPTSGPPIRFDWVPPGAQIFVIVRPAEMLASDEGRRVLQALGPEFDAERQKWEAAAGFNLSEISVLHLSLHEDSAGTLRPAFVVHLTEPLAADALLERWGNPPPIPAGKNQYYHARDWSLYIPDRSGMFVMGGDEDIQGVIEFQGGAPPLGPIQQLLAATDANRHVTLLYTPHAVFNELLRDGREYYFGPARKARQPIDWLMGDGVDAGTMSLHLGDTAYFEMRFFGRRKDRHRLAAEFRERLEQVPDNIEQYSAASIPHPHWRIVANRYPSMVRFLASQMRVSVERDEAIINVALPETAVHNLVFGGLMFLISPEVVLANEPEPTPTVPQTLSDLLGAKTSVSFDQLSLEDSIKFIETTVREDYPRLPFDFRIVILGSDLQKDGITQNQQVRDFKLQDSTVAEALTGIVVKAQATGKPPSAPEQKLIWVVGPDPEQPGTQVVLVTTRAAAAEKAYTIPQPFLAR